MQTLPERAFSPVEKHQALDLILQSQTFARADQLRKFLRYICEMEENGRAEEISEYSIATEALGRPRSYSPAADSGVRGRAHDLRLKLDQFYETENPHARVRLGLRRGSYAPFFYGAEPPHEVLPVALPPTQLAAPPRTRQPSNLIRVLAFGAALVAVSVIATRGFYIQRAAQLDPVVKQFWGPLAKPGADVLICLGTPPSLLIKPYSKPPNPDIFRPLIADKSAWYSRLQLPNVPGQPYVYFSGNSPLFGDAEAAAFAVRVLSVAGASYDFIPENTAQPAALRNHNVLLIGSPNYSEYAARVLKKAPFTIVEDSRLGEEVIREQTGAVQPKIFIPQRDESGSLVLVYGLVTVFQNQALSDVTSRTIVVSGVTGAASAAAMHFFTSPNGLKTLLLRLHKDGLKEPPPAYQVVVKGTRDKAVPLAWELADFRQMKRFPSVD